jgi:orotidine-5'-phosphate decarboxylase
MEQTDLAGIGLDMSPQLQVERLAMLAQNSGLDGVVCSAQEAISLKALCGKDFNLVTPGIRPSFALQGDQRRIMTPSQAIEAGVDYMVIGRPITQAKDPIEALTLIEQEISAFR